MNEITPSDDNTDTSPVQAADEISQDSRNLALLIWIGTIFLGFIPSLILFLMKKGDEYVADQTKEALNWSITVVIGYVASLLLTIILIGPFLMYAIIVCNLVFGVLGAIACSKGDQYRVPWTLRLLS
jgi:uncharacterized protein